MIDGPKTKGQPERRTRQDRRTGKDRRDPPGGIERHVATLLAVTKEAQLALGGRREVRVTQFPFKVGRESRVAALPANRALIELRLGVAPQLNDLYLVEPTWVDMLQISLEHFAIEYADDHFFLVDRASACGTMVAGKKVGGSRTGGRTELRSGDELIVGTDESPYVFRFEIVPG